MTETPAQRTRAKELDRIARLGATPLQSPCTLKVVGVSFTRHYPANLYALLERYDDRADERLPVILVRDRINKHDPNAIQVHVPALDTMAFVGHLTTPIAARLAPELDAGVKWKGGVTNVLLTPGHEDRPGISITLERIG